QRLGHDTVGAGALGTVDSDCRAPDREDGCVGLESSISDQHAQQIAFLKCEVALPRRVGAMVVEEHQVATAQGTRGTPVCIGRAACHLCHAPHAMLGGQAERIAFGRLQADELLSAGREEPFWSCRVVTPIYPGLERLPDKIAHEARTTGSM